MRVILTICTVYLFGFPLLSQGDEVIWSYDLTILPPGWLNDGFDFDSNGASLYKEGVWYPDSNGSDILALSYSYSYYLRSEIITVPDGLDSLVLIVPQYLYLSASASGSANADITVNANVHGVNQSLRYREVHAYGSSDELTDTTTIHEAITDLIPNMSVYFEFLGHHGGFNGTTLIHWRLYSAQLLGYGDLGLLQTTWGGIKSLLVGGEFDAGGIDSYLRVVL